MEGTATFGLLIAFTAGLVSFLSPCVLPLIPSYITFITGMSVDEVQTARRAAVIHSILFIAGFTLIFLLLGATATAVGRALLVYRDWLSRIGGALIILFGLYLAGALNVGPLAREQRIHIADKPVGYLGTVLVGVAFGAGWTPCIGPILGSILIYTSSHADLGRGLGLLFAYSLGLAVPFLVSSVAITHFLTAFARFRRHIGWVSRVGGAVLVLIGILLLTNYFTLLASYLQALTPEFVKRRL